MNYYVDIHSNLSPAVPTVSGGTLTREEALSRTELFRDSNIKTAVAAPFFSPDFTDSQAFLKARDHAISGLGDSAQPMRIVGGAVLPLQYCLEHPRDLRQFALGESDYLLIELPHGRITGELCENITRLRIVSGLYPVAVDIDRHYDIWTPEDWIALRPTGTLLQISIDGLLNPEHRKLSLYLLANQYAHFVATGSRNIKEPLHFTEAMRIIQRNLPAQLYRRVKNNPGMLLSNAEPSAFLES